jgi:hypothetical protein
MVIYCWVLLMGPLSMSAVSSVLPEPLDSVGQQVSWVMLGVTVQPFCLAPERLRRTMEKKVTTGLTFPVLNSASISVPETAGPNLPT